MSNCQSHCQFDYTDSNLPHRLVEQVRGRRGAVAREPPRYELQELQAGPERGLQRVAGRYKISRWAVLRATLGKTISWVSERATLDGWQPERIKVHLQLA